MLAGTVTGRVVIFHLKELKEEANNPEITTDSLVELLPKEFQDLLQNKDVVKIGSEITRDLVDLKIRGIDIHTTANTRSLFHSFGGIFNSFNPTNKYGLGFISEVLTDINYKPTWANRVRFKRIPFLYAWKEENWMFSEGYMRNDALVPCLLVLTLAKRRIHRKLTRETTLKGAILELYEILGTIPKRPELEFIESEEEAEIEIRMKEYEATKAMRFGGNEDTPYTIQLSGDASKVPIHEWSDNDLRFKIGTEQGIGEKYDPEVVTYYDSDGDRPNRALPVQAEEVNRPNLALHDQKASESCVLPAHIFNLDRLGSVRIACESGTEPVTSNKRKRKVMDKVQPECPAKKFKACDGRPRSVPNERRISPTFDMLCMFCGSDKHTMYLPGKRDLVQCPSYQPPREDLCEYRHCDDRSSHLTAVCHRLHDRCHACKFRGHHKSICERFTTTEFRNEFEKTADLGVFTSWRFDNPNWGFYWIEDDARAEEVKTKRPHIMKFLKTRLVKKAVQMLNRGKL